jgi:hypothetical protein
VAVVSVSALGAGESAWSCWELVVASLGSVILSEDDVEESSVGKAVVEVEASGVPARVFSRVCRFGSGRRRMARKIPSPLSAPTRPTPSRAR